VVAFVHLNTALDTLNQPKQQRHPDNDKSHPEIEPLVYIPSVSQYPHCSAVHGCKLVYQFFQHDESIAIVDEVVEAPFLWSEIAAFGKITVYAAGVWVF
jgi:hypothetical protein